MFQKKADDAAGLTPGKEDNAFWCNLDRKDLKLLIRFSYKRRGTTPLQKKL